MRRGDVWQVDFDPRVAARRTSRARGHRQQRPSQRNGRTPRLRHDHGRPVTSNVDNIHPFQVFLSTTTSGLAVDSKAQAEQVRLHLAL